MGESICGNIAIRPEGSNESKGDIENGEKNVDRVKNTDEACGHADPQKRNYP